MSEEKTLSQGYLKETTSTLRKKQENLALLKEITEKETSKPPAMRFGSVSPSASPVPEGGSEPKEITEEREKPVNDENLIRSTAPSREKTSRLPAPPTKGPMRFSVSYRSSPIPTKHPSVSPRSVNVGTTATSTITTVDNARKASRPKSRPISQPPRGRTTSRSTSPVPLPKKPRVELPVTKHGKTNVNVEIFLPKPHNEEDEEAEGGEQQLETVKAPPASAVKAKDIKVEIFMPSGTPQELEDEKKNLPQEHSQILSGDGLMSKSVTPVAKPTHKRPDLLQSGCRSEVLGGESDSRVVDDEEEAHRPQEEEETEEELKMSAKATPDRCQRSAILLPPQSETQRSYVLDDSQEPSSGLPKPPPPHAEDEETPKRQNNEFPLPRFSVRTPGALLEAFARAVPSPVRHTPVREGEFQTPLPVTRMTLTPTPSTAPTDGDTSASLIVETSAIVRDASPVPTPAKVVDSIHASGEKRCCSRPSPAKPSKSAVADDSASRKRSRSFNSPLPTTENLIQSVQASADRRPCGCARPTPKSPPPVSESTGRSPAIHIHTEQGAVTADSSSPPHARRCCDRPTPVSISVSEAAVPNVSKSVCSPSPWPSTENIISSITVEKRGISDAVGAVDASAEPKEGKEQEEEEQELIAEEAENDGSPALSPGHVLSSVQKEGTTRRLTPPASARTPSPVFTEREIAESVLASADKRRGGRPSRDSKEPESSKPPVQLETSATAAARTPSPVPDKEKLIESLETSARKQAYPDREESPKPVHQSTLPLNRPPSFKTASPIPTQEDVDSSVLASADKRQKAVSQDASPCSATFMVPPPSALSATVTELSVGSPKLLPQHITSSLRIIEEVLDCKRSGAMEPVSAPRTNDFSSPAPVPQVKNDEKSTQNNEGADKRSGAMERDGTCEKALDVFASPAPVPTQEDEDERAKKIESSEGGARSAAVPRSSASAFPPGSEVKEDSNLSPVPEPQHFLEEEETEEPQVAKGVEKRSGAIERPCSTSLQTEEVDFASPTVTLKEVAESEEVLQMEEATESRSERQPRTAAEAKQLGGEKTTTTTTTTTTISEQNASPTFSDICQPSEMFQDCVSAPPTPQFLPPEFFQLQRDVKAISEGRASRPAGLKEEKQVQTQIPTVEVAALERQSTILGTGDVAVSAFRPNDIQHPHEPIDGEQGSAVEKEEKDETLVADVSLTPLPTHRTGVITTSAIVANDCLPRPVTLSSQMEAYVARRSAEKAASISVSMHHASVSPRVRSFSKGSSRSPPPPMATTTYKRESFEPNLKDDDRVFESSPEASETLQETPPPKAPVTRSPSKEMAVATSESAVETPEEPSRKRGRRSQLEQIMDLLPTSVAEEVRRSDTLLSSDSLLQAESEEAMGTPGRLSGASQSSISARVTERPRDKYFDYKAYEKYLNEMNRPVSRKEKKQAKKRAKKQQQREQKQKQQKQEVAAQPKRVVAATVKVPPPSPPKKKKVEKEATTKKKAVVQNSSPKCRLVRAETGPWNYVSTTELPDELEQAIFKYPHHTTPKPSTLDAHAVKGAKKAAQKKAHKAKPASPKKTSPAKAFPSQKAATTGSRTTSSTTSSSSSSSKKSSPSVSSLASSSPASTKEAKLKVAKKKLHAPGKSKKLRKFKDKRR